jgi:hypothetical protein
MVYANSFKTVPLCGFYYKHQSLNHIVGEAVDEKYLDDQIDIE